MVDSAGCSDAITAGPSTAILFVESTSGSRAFPSFATWKDSMGWRSGRTLTTLIRHAEKAQRNY